MRSTLHTIIARRLWRATLLLLPFLALSSCEKDPLRYGMHDVTFNATIEQFTNNEKIVLRDEQWIYWEVGDEISIGSELTDGSTYHQEKGDLVNASPGTDFEDFNGVFVASLPEGSTKFLGLHPYSPNNVIVGSGSEPYFSTVKLDLAAQQPLRNDSTFSRKVFPMVAWYGGEWTEEHPTPFNLDFHALGSIVRFQLFNNTGSNATISSITFSTREGSGSMQLSGLFTVNNFTSFNPYLTAKGSPTEAEQKVTITCGEDGVGFPGDKLLTFYLVLPAVGNGTTTNYKLQMDVLNSLGEHCIKRLNVPVRRAGITYMNAMGITSWGDAEGGGTASAGLVGVGTSTRPFKIYTKADLKYLRDCYTDTVLGRPRTINKQPITKNTHICLMRSDILINSEDWTIGIPNFTGVFTSRLTNAGEEGITNNSQHPLFESITADGKVDGITVISGTAFSTLAGYEDGFSPFCNVNRGMIKDCNTLMYNNGVSDIGLSSTYTSLAGICVKNYGTLQGCSNNTTMTVGEGLHVGGVCLINAAGGIVSRCQVTSEFTVSGNAQVGGICYENSGTVQDCFFGSRGNTSSTSSWGAVVYANSGTVNYCYCSHTASIVTSGTVAGIVNSNSGTVNYCYSMGQLEGSCVGGIVMNLTDGKVINCYIDNTLAQITLHAGSASDYGGGLVGAMSGGDLQNSYIHIATVRQDGTTGVRGGLVGKVTGGKVSNCYAYERSSAVHSFYGSTDVATVARYENCYLVSGTQTGTSIINVTTSVASSAAEDGLTARLNEHRPSGDDPTALSWSLSGTHPVLVAPSSKSRK